MNKVKVLSIFSIGMFAINLILICFLVFNKMKPNRREGPKKVIIERLHFDESQTMAYEKLIDGHKGSIRQLDARIMDLKKQLYTNLHAEQPAGSPDSLIAEIANVQVQVEKINYEHFQDIKQLCKPDQLTLFADLCDDIGMLFARKSLPPNEK